MTPFTLLALLLQLQISSSSPTIRWWMSVNEVENNLALIEGSGVVHGLYTYIGAMVWSDGCEGSAKASAARVASDSGRAGELTLE